MDKKLRKWTYAWAVLSAGILAVLPASVDAEMLLMTPKVPTTSKVVTTPEHYPESHFSKPAPDVKRGIETGFMDMEIATIDDEVVTKRSPASINGGAPSALGADPDTAALIGKRGGVQEVALIAGDLGYFPKTVFVTRDIPVRMFVTGASRNSLCIMMDQFHVSKQVRSQKIEEISFTPTSPGKYRFYCPINGMEGIMVVKEFAAANSAAAE